MSDAREFDKGKAKPWTQSNFGGGMVKNAPHEEIPDNSVALLRNAHAFPTEIQPRLASRVYAAIQPPVLEDSSGTPRSGYGATKTGYIITSLSGNIFDEGDASHFFVWPGSPNFHDEIYEYISPTQVRVGDSGDRVATYGCWFHARLNLNTFHKGLRKKVYQWGTDVYVADDLTLASWTKAICVSFDQPHNSISDWDEMDDFGVIANSGGIFLLDFTLEVPVIFKKNTPIPSILIEEEDREELSKFRYDYTYGMCRLSGNGLRDRTAEGAVLRQESGTCALNVNESPERDYGTLWTERMIDKETQTMGRLVGYQLTRAHSRPSWWFGLTGAAAATFRLQINNSLQDFFIDFGPAGFAVGSLGDVAQAIQMTIRAVFPFATCEYLKDTNNFVMTSGREPRSTIEYLIDGDAPGYTNISDVLEMRLIDDATLDNLYPFASPHEVGVLAIPKNATRPEYPEWHWTHYTIYRTTDIGPDGVTVRVVKSTGDELQPLKFTWTKDIPVAKAFLASRSATGYVTASVGEFSQDDVGTPLKWEDGEVDTIVSVLSSILALTTGVGAPRSYYDLKKKNEACAIGGGRVLRGSQTGHIVKRVSGDIFTAEDERKTIFWSTGYYSYITEYVDSDTVLAHDAMDKETQGFTLDPVNRTFQDDVPDKTLRNRQGERYIGLLAHRFYVAMPSVNVMGIVPGFMITARHGESTIHYCQLPNSKKYLSGYYLENRQQNDRIDGSIVSIKKIPNKFIVFCITSTWGGPTNVPDIKKLPEFGEAYSVLHADVIDERIGIVDVGSIREVDYGVYELRTSDNAWRQFSEYGYNKQLGDMSVSKATGQDIVKRDLTDTWPVGVSAYLDNLGHIWWGKRK